MKTDGVFLCIFKIHVYFQDTYFQDVISTKKYIFSRCNLYKEIYIFRKGNIQLCSELFQRVHTVFCQKNIKTIVFFSKKPKNELFICYKSTTTRVCCQDKHKNEGLLSGQTRQRGFVVKTNTTTRVCCQDKHENEGLLSRQTQKPGKYSDFYD